MIRHLISQWPYTYPTPKQRSDEHQTYLQLGVGLEVVGRRPTLQGGVGDGALGQGHDVRVLAVAEHPGVVAANRLLGLGQAVGVAAGRRVELVRLPGRLLVLALVDAPALRARRLEEHAHVRYVEGLACGAKIKGKCDQLFFLLQIR